MKGWLLLLPFLASASSSTNYTLQTYDFVSSGSPTSSNYQLHAAAGNQSGHTASTNYTLPAGVKASMTAAVPGAPTVSNPNSYYDRLQVVLNTGSAPSDTKYLIALSPDSFATTYYVHPDQTIGLSASIGDYQTYTAWGGASGVMVLGLQASTTYQVKVAALQGAGTGSGFGPVGSAGTATPSVTFALSTSLTSTPPFAVGLALTPGVVTSGTATITATVTTNAASGGSLLLKGTNNGLTSAGSAYTIASASTDLDTASAGYGAQVSGVAQTSGGPMVAVSPYDGVNNIVGQIAASYQPLASFGTPINTGSVTLGLKAKSDIASAVANDYADTLSLTLSLIF